MSIRGLSLVGLAVTALAIAFIAANAEHGPIFWTLLTEHDDPAAWVTGAILLVGVFAARDEADWAERLVAALDRNRYFVAAGLWVLLAAGSIFVYRNHPLSMDEYAAVFQARVFAAGQLHGQFPPELFDYLIPHNFQNQFLMVNRGTGAVFSAYWPGFSLILTPFVYLGIPWACNATIVALSLLLIRRLTRDIVEGATAPGWAMLLAIASPAFVVNGISYYSMPSHLLANLAFAWLLIAPTQGRLVLAGIAGGCALVLHNPFPHAVFALPWILWLAVRTAGGNVPQRIRDLGLLALGYLPIVLLLGVGWTLWQRHALQIGFESLAANSGLAASAVAIGDRLASVIAGLVQHFRLPDQDLAMARVAGLVKLFLWGSPVLLLLAWTGGRRAQNEMLRLCFDSALLTFFAYFVIPFDQGHGWGYRYFHSAWGVLPILAAAGVAQIRGASEPWVFNRLAMMLLASLLIANGLRVYQVGVFVDKHLSQRPPQTAGRQIVFHNGVGYYANDLIQNDPWLRGETVMLLSGRPRAESTLLQRYFPGEYVARSNRYGTSYTQLP